MRATGKTRSAFTLVELVVVIMILGILAAVAAPRMLGASQEATENGVRHSLSVIRDAIDRYVSDHNGTLPGADNNETTLKSDLSEYLRGGFPTCPVGAAQNSAVRMVDSAETPGSDGSDTTESWMYNSKSGEFFVNSQDMSSDDTTVYGNF